MKRKGATKSRKTQRNKKTKNDKDKSQHASGLEFPDLVVHQILSLVTTRLGARFRILSKQWDRLWSSLPVIEIDEDQDDKQQQQTLEESKKIRTEFLKFLRSCLERRSAEHNLPIEKLRLRMRCLDNSNWLNNALSVAVEGNLLKELDLCILESSRTRKWSYYRYCNPFHLRQTILESVKSLTVLKLENVVINSDVDMSIDLPCLKTMSLESVEFKTDLLVLPLLSGCPVIEHLFLSRVTCTSSTSQFKISSSSLRSLHGTPRNTSELDAVNLESLRVDCYSDLPIRDVSSCRNLTSLEFGENSQLRSSWFEDLDSKAPLLETLILHNCQVATGEHINLISHEHLKRFVVFGYLFRNLSTNFPNSLEAVIVLENTYWSEKNWREYGPSFLGNVYCSRKTVLHSPNAELLIISEVYRNGRAPPCPRLKNLEVHIATSTTAQSLSALKNSFRWMAPSGELILDIKENSSQIISEFQRKN